MSDRKRIKIESVKEKKDGKEFKNETSESKVNTGMDEKNKKALNVLMTEGDRAFVEHVFTGENGRQLSYAEMRSRYG